MEIQRSLDIENVIREALADHFRIYCRPFPENYELPNLLVTQVGGSDTNQIDTFEVVLDSRADSEADALLYLRNALGVLKQLAAMQHTSIGYVKVNSSGSWGSDPVRPDLAMCSARIRVIAHPEKAII